jgi:hypothetical protein
MQRQSPRQCQLPFQVAAESFAWTIWHAGRQTPAFLVCTRWPAHTGPRHYPYLLRNLAKFLPKPRPQGPSTCEAAHVSPSGSWGVPRRRRQPVQEHLDRRHLNSHRHLSCGLSAWSCID